MNKYDVQLVLGDLKVEGSLIFNEQDLTIDTFKTTYVIKYGNILEYYFKDDGIVLVTETKEYILVTSEANDIKSILDDKIKPEKEIIIDGEEKQEKKDTDNYEHLLFSDSNKYGSYNFYNSYMEIDYKEAGFDCDNLIIKYSDIEDLDFHATSDSEYMFLYIVTKKETYDFYFNKDKVDECRKILEPRITIEKEVYEDGNNIDNKESVTGGNSGIQWIVSFAVFIIFMFILYAWSDGSLKGNLKISGCYYRIDSIFDVKDKNNSLCFDGNNVIFKHNNNSYKLTREWARNTFYIENNYGESLFSCNLNSNDSSEVKCSSNNTILGDETTIWTK